MEIYINNQKEIEISNEGKNFTYNEIGEILVNLVKKLSALKAEEQNIHQQLASIKIESYLVDFLISENDIQ